MSNVPYNKLMEQQDCEFFQIAFLALVKKNGGTIAMTGREIVEAHGLEGSIEQIGDKYIVKVKPKSPNFDETKAKEYFDEAKRNADKRPQAVS